jgi:hypothetical protein
MNTTSLHGTDTLGRECTPPGELMIKGHRITPVLAVKLMHIRSTPSTFINVTMSFSLDGAFSSFFGKCCHSYAAVVRQATQS